MLLPFVRLRPHRLAHGEALFLWQALPAAWAWGLGATWVLCAVSTRLWRRRRGLTALTALLAQLLVVAPVALAGIAATRLSAPGGLVRVSLAAGAWVMVLSGLSVTMASRRAFAPSAWWLVLPCLLGLAGLAQAGTLDDLSLVQEYALRRHRFWQEGVRHLLLSGTAVGCAALLGLPMGIAAHRRPALARLVFPLTNAVQTVPSLALFGMLMAPLALLASSAPWLRKSGFGGIGWAPALIALTLYALLPIVRNTYAGLQMVDVAVRQAGMGMGMTPLQLFCMLELPLALPAVVGGVRTAAVQAVGNTTVAALIGAGGWGTLVFQGLGQAAPDLVVLGTLPVILAAMGVDAMMASLQRWAVPPGVGGDYG
ncbi:MAG: ABC transporter permease [Syntrophomonadaceae bacterium]|nr:ABC transporter permease [Syntrophomonadaceae bacterium]MDH7496951.1 ABC transporter permease [Syntrophomonadaceae bacterium]